MARPATARLKVNPPLGVLPVLQYALPAQLHIDAAYQRSIDGVQSLKLIRKIAMHWNWDLCLPLVVSRREDGALFVIDGQHRLEAAKLRGDIAQLPCVVGAYASAADEAASFVHLNQQRRALSKLEVFKAAVASEDPEACAIVAALTAAGLSVAPHTNYISWKPGMVSNIGGIEAIWRKHGAAATTRALMVLGAVWPGQVLRYAGTVFPGIAAICAADGEEVEIGLLCEMVEQRGQAEWRKLIQMRRVDDPNMSFAQGGAAVFEDAWDEFLGEVVTSEPMFFSAVPVQPAPKPGARPAPAKGIVPGQSRWCEQCDLKVTATEAANCQSRFCKAKDAA